MVNKLSEQYISTRTPPINLQLEHRYLFQHEFKKQMRETHIRILRNGYILKDILLVPQLMRFFVGYSRVHKISGKTKYHLLKMLLKKGQSPIDKALWVTDDWSKMFFHWLTDALPRVIASEKMGANVPVLLSKDYENFKFVQKSLEILNRKIIYYNPANKLHFNTLIVPSHTARSGNYNNEIINTVRNRFLNTKKNAFRKIYLSRAKAPRRKIINENEVQLIMAKYNIEIHYFEDYSFEKQVSIMNEACLLIGLHGAGLTNMLFMPKNGKILELRSEGDNKNNCFFTLASELEHNYYYLCSPTDSTDWHNANSNVNLDEFEEIVQQVV